MSRINAISDSSADTVGRGRVPYCFINDFGIGDDKTITRPVEGVPSGRTLQTAFLTVKSHASDADGSALFKLEIGPSSTSAGEITAAAHGVGAVRFELTGSHTSSAGIIAGAQFDIEVLDDLGHVYTVDRGRIQPCIPEVRTDAPHVIAPFWRMRDVSLELPTGQARRIGWELLDDFIARDDYTIRRPVQIPAGRTLSSLTFYAFTNATDLNGSALVSAAATVTDSGASGGIAAVTIALTEGQTNQLRSAVSWRAVGTLDNGKKYTAQVGTIWAQDDITDASTAAVATVVWDPTTESVGSGSAVVATVRCYSIGGAELIGRSISGVASDATGVATCTPSSGVSPLAVTISGVADGSANIAAQSGSIHATPLPVTVAPAGVYGVLSPDPILWLKPDTIAHYADGADVLVWPDSSPNGWDMEPFVSTGHTGGRDAAVLGGAVRFESANSEAMENTSFDSMASLTGYSLFIVCKDATSGGCLFGSSGYDYWEGYYSGGHFRCDLGGFGYGGYYSWTADTAPHIRETRYDGTQASASDKLKQILDGVAQAVSTYMPPASLASANGITLAHGAGLSHYNGWVAEVLMFGVRLSDSDCDMVRTALAAKYGI